MLQFGFYEKTCVLTEIAEFCLYLPTSCLVLAAYNKTNIPSLSLFNIEMIHPR